MLENTCGGVRAHLVRSVVLVSNGGGSNGRQDGRSGGRYVTVGANATEQYQVLLQLLQQPRLRGQWQCCGEWRWW